MRGSRGSQTLLSRQSERVRAAEHAPRGPCRLLKRRHGLAEFSERGAGVAVERLRVIQAHSQIECITFAKDAVRQGYRFAQQRLSFCVAL